MRQLKIFLSIIVYLAILEDFHLCLARKVSRPRPPRPRPSAPVDHPHSRSTPPPPGFKDPHQQTGSNPNPGWNIPEKPNSQTHVNPSQSKPTGTNPGWNIPERPNSPTHINPSQSNPTGTNYGWNIPQKPNPGTHFNNPSPNYPSGPTHVKIENKYTYNYPGHYSVPAQNPHYTGYYSAPSYNYHTSDTGSGALGFFLGYGLAKLTTPTYSHYSFYDGYRPRYDHYEVHHYYHNKESVSKDQDIQSKNIVPCIGDTPTVCPANTTALCTSEGALMCVVSIVNTVPCLDNKQCVRSEIPCVNKTAEECKDASKNATVMNIPCVSKTKIHGNIEVVNNTLVPEGYNNSVVSVSFESKNVTVANNNNNTSVTQNATNSTNNTESSIVVTTTPVITTTPDVTTTVHSRRKRDVTKDYCVTIVALPAKRRNTEGEKFFSAAGGILEKFFTRAWGLS